MKGREVATEKESLLAGLRDALRAQTKEHEAGEIDEQLRAATKNVDAISVASRPQ